MSGLYDMQIEGKEYTQLIVVSNHVTLYQVYHCREYLSGHILWKKTETRSKQIGFITCLNHPSKDGTNPHWRIILEINRTEKEKLNSISLTRFTDRLKTETHIEDPIWIELREFETVASEAIGDFWSYD